jgi:hypothetical protein
MRAAESSARSVFPKAGKPDPLGLLDEAHRRSRNSKAGPWSKGGAQRGRDRREQAEADAKLIVSEASGLMRRTRDEDGRHLSLRAVARLLGRRPTIHLAESTVYRILCTHRARLIPPE